MNQLRSCGSGLAVVLQDNVRRLSPAYFALVMASGIVSLAAFHFDLLRTASLLFYFNIGAYILLCVLYLARLIFYPGQVRDDFNDHSRNPGFLTFVAASCVLGIQFLQLAGSHRVASWLFYAGLISWLILIYSFFTVITTRNPKPSLRESISGVWLLAVVSTQSVAVLGIHLSSHLPVPQEQMLFFAFILFLCGCMLYIVIITLLVYRLSFFEMHAEEFAPPYWISMGAVAITALAGAGLMTHHHGFHLLGSLFPFVEGFTFFFWAIGTWWIPLILILSLWRHAIKLLPFRYHPQYWGMVFPLGMYATCTTELSQASGVNFINVISFTFLLVSLVAWLITFTAMVWTLCTEIYLAVSESLKAGNTDVKTNKSL